MKKQILSIVFLSLVSTSVMAQKTPDYFAGNDNKRITCDEDGEADRVVLDMAEEGGGREHFKESLKKMGEKLSDKLIAILTKKEVSGRTFPDEMDDYVKKAVCITKVVAAGKVADGFDVRFKKNLANVEFLVRDNRKTMPSYEDASSPSEQSNAYANDVIEANRGAVAFVCTMFE